MNKKKLQDIDKPVVKLDNKMYCAAPIRLPQRGGGAEKKKKKNLAAHSLRAGCIP